MTRQRTRLWTATVILTLTVGLSCTHAAISFSEVTWDATAGDTLGWIVDGAVAGVTSPDAGGNPNGYLRLEFPAPGGMGVPIEVDGMSTTAEGFIGNYNSYPGLALDFEMFVSHPSLVQQLYFESGGGSTWFTPLAGTVGAWTPQSVDFSSVAGWTPFAVGETFFNALSDVTAIGITVSHMHVPTDEAFYYGIDGWQYGATGSGAGAAIPEPGEVAMGITFLLSLAGAFRNQIQESVKTLLKRGDTETA